jgi:hypothetical protein
MLRQKAEVLLAHAASGTPAFQKWQQVANRIVQVVLRYDHIRPRTPIELDYGI